jgi:L-ascorbate metabolism protein UlaG (beta-lactamase superfamily)
MTVCCRWLGVAGVELISNNQVLVIDPYFTRFPFWKMLIGPVRPQADVITHSVQRCDHILVTHSHFDHMMDVPTLALQTGATILGSPNACQIATASGVPVGQTHRIDAGDQLSLGEFQVSVLPALHGKTSLDWLINGPIVHNLTPPLRALDYRMDECFTFLVTVAGIRLLIGGCETIQENAPADILIAGMVGLTMNRYLYYKALMRRVRPKVVIPYHWDDMYRPLSKPTWPSFEMPSLSSPTLRRVDMSGFSQMIEKIAPDTQVIIPEIFHTYDISKLL